MYRPHLKTSTTNFQILSEYKKTDNITTFAKKYDIVINDDGSVYDLITHSNHNCIMTWLEKLFK